MKSKTVKFKDSEVAEKTYARWSGMGFQKVEKTFVDGVYGVTAWWFGKEPSRPKKDTGGKPKFRN